MVIVTHIVSAFIEIQRSIWGHYLELQMNPLSLDYAGECRGVRLTYFR